MILETINISEFNDILNVDAQDEIDYIDYSDDVKEIVNNIDLTTKFKSTLSVIENLISEGKNVCLWCIFIDTMNSFSQYLKNLGISNCIINGDVSTEDRNIFIQKFKDGEISVLITNPHTLAESVSLHKYCHDAIYFEYSYNLVRLLQSKDRIHRLGLPEGQYTQYYFMTLDFLIDGRRYSLDEKI